MTHFIRISFNLALIILSDIIAIVCSNISKDEKGKEKLFEVLSCFFNYTLLNTSFVIFGSISMDDEAIAIIGTFTGGVISFILYLVDSMILKYIDTEKDKMALWKFIIVIFRVMFVVFSIAILIAKEFAV